LEGEEEVYGFEKEHVMGAEWRQGIFEGMKLDLGEEYRLDCRAASGCDTTFI